MCKGMHHLPLITHHLSFITKKQKASRSFPDAGTRVEIACSIKVTLFLHPGKPLFAINYSLFANIYFGCITISGINISSKEIPPC